MYLSVFLALTQRQTHSPAQSTWTCKNSKVSNPILQPRCGLLRYASLQPGSRNTCVRLCALLRPGPVTQQSDSLALPQLGGGGLVGDRCGDVSLPIQPWLKAVCQPRPGENLAEVAKIAEEKERAYAISLL